MEQEIRAWVLDWFQKQSHVPLTELENHMDENYFECGYMDSFAFIELVADTEARWGITFANDQFLNRSFATLAGFIRIVLEKQKEIKG